MSRNAGLLAGLRLGFGMRSAKLIAGQPLQLGGARLVSECGPEAGATGEQDLLCQALIEALLGACGLPDLPTLFAGDATLRQTDPYIQLSETVTALMRQRLARILNVNLRVLYAAADLSAERNRMLNLLAGALQVEPLQIALAFDQGQVFSEIVAGHALLTMATVLCVLNESEPAKSVATKLTQNMFSNATPSTGIGDVLVDPNLPPRAQQFERAVQTKLPPLPKAPRPAAGDSLIVYTDGASRGNPGPAAAGFVVLDAQGRLVYEGGSTLGVCTNNEAEYKALAEAARWIGAELGYTHVLDLRLDSELVVKQLSGEYKVKDPELKQLVMLTMNELMNFQSFTLKHVPRTENSRADALANQALDAKG